MLRERLTVRAGIVTESFLALEHEEMIGNVSEWCQPSAPGTATGDFPPSKPIVSLPDDEEEKVETVVRGACFFRTSANAMKCSHRRNLSVARRNQWVGFRPACLLPVRLRTN